MDCRESVGTVTPKKKIKTHRWLLAYASRLSFLKKNNHLSEAEVLNVKEENNVSSRLRCKVGGNTAQTTPVCPPEAFRLSHYLL